MPKKPLDTLRLVELICQLPPHITNNATNEKALKVIGALITKTEKHRTGAETLYLKMLSDEVVRYESKRFPEYNERATPLELLHLNIEFSEATKDELCEILGCSRSTLARILKGERELRQSEVAKLTRRFRTHPESYIPQLTVKQDKAIERVYRKYRS